MAGIPGRLDETGVPHELAVPLIAGLYRMRSSDAAPLPCIALEGEIGKRVRCAIFDRRPSPCRDFAPYALLGVDDEACARASWRHGLKPLGEMRVG